MICCIHDNDKLPLVSSSYKVVQMSILGSQIHFLTETNDIYFCGEILTEKYENYTPGRNYIVILQ